MSDVLGWPVGVVVPTRKKRGSGYPTSYKIDVANADLMVGIEIDGGSHGSIERQVQDRKKQQLLESMGWTILRFTNGEVDADLDGCVKAVLSAVEERSTA